MVLLQKNDRLSAPSFERKQIVGMIHNAAPKSRDPKAQLQGRAVNGTRARLDDNAHCVIIVKNSNCEVVMRKIHFLSACLLGAAISATAAEPIGYVKTVTGDGFVISAGKSTKAIAGSPTSGTSATTTSTAVSKEIASLSSGTKYWFWVRATNTDGKSGWAGPASATTDAAATAPAAPTGVTIGTLVYDHPILDLANTLTRITNTSKRQDWTYSATVNYPISWTKSTGATTYEIYASGSATAPTSGTSGNVSTDTGDVSSYSSYKPTQSQRGTLTRYIWVRASNTTGNSAWAAASTNAGGGKTSVATVVSGLVLRIWRGNGTASSTPSPTPPANTAITYLWSVTSRGDPNNATTPGEGHYCTIDQYFTIAGVDDYATASDTV